MSTKKHTQHPNLTGEHRWGDSGQLILLLMFLGIWITDSFILHYSTFLSEVVPNYVRVPLAGLVLMAGWHLARGGMKAVFYFLISRYEERILAEAFGDDYLEYKRKTGMLFPKLFSS